MRIWERTEGREGIEPIPALLDETRYGLRLAKELGVTAMELPGVPLHLRAAAMVDLEIQGIQHKRAERRAASRRKSATSRRQP